MPAMDMTSPVALPADWRDFLALTKPRVMYLVVFTGLCGMLAAPAMPPLAPFTIKTRLRLPSPTSLMAQAAGAPPSSAAMSGRPAR